MTPRVISVGCATPPFVVAQAETKAFARNFFSGSLRALDRMLSAFDNTRIESRQLVRPLDWYEQPHSFHEKNAVVCESALELSVRAAAQALERAALDVDAVVFVSSTGVRTPSLDVPLIERLGLRRDVVRLPVWGLGCAGGAAGLARAAELVVARQKPVLLVAAEVCSGTFVHGDRSRANLIATALFGDGAAAVVLAPGETGVAVGPSVSRLLEDSEDVMGWTMIEEGLRVRFARSIPSIVRSVVPDMRVGAARVAGVSADAFTRFVLHPGGAKVLEAYEDALSVESAVLDDAYTVLRDHGNMSSPTVLFVLARMLERLSSTDSIHEPLRARTGEQASQLGLLLGLGPGFSAEGVVLRWDR